jgi:iron complex transport system ATP-binding protein
MAPLFDVSSVMFSYRVPGSGIQSGSGSGAEPGSDVPGSFSGRATINDTTVSLPAGRFYGIIGPNGCGKTTLIDLLMGQLRPDSGRVCFSGREVSMIPARERARQMALVPQVYSVNFPFTVGEVVAMGRYPHLSRFGALGPTDMAIVTETMDLTDTRRFAHRRINQLSGGERQRVVFARALAQQAPVLFLDEATANLDINHSLALLTLAAERVKDGGTVISVFQDINLAAMFCDHLLLMESGRCVAHGSIREVLTVANLNRLFGVQCQVEENSFNHHLQVMFKG